MDEARFMPLSPYVAGWWWFPDVSALQLNGNVFDYLVDLGRFLGQESHDFPGLIK